MSEGKSGRTENAEVRYLNPYDQAFVYRQAGWGGPLWLPYKKKEKPPIGYTGHKAKYPTVDDIKDWQNEKGRKNICLRLAGVDENHEVIGIDVDHYKKGDKNKRGGDQLLALEQTLGTLPETWTSSSRTDGVSGIRYFRVPRGMAFRGQVDKDIECISKGYRYAIVWPSIHDELGSTYWWFPPGTMPNESGRAVWDQSELPMAWDLPKLPDNWLSYLTQGGMRSTQQRIDMDSSKDEIYTWADNTFHRVEGDGENGQNTICPLMREKLDKLKKKILGEATSHDKLTNAHWNIFKLAAEGHLGWNDANNELEQCFYDEMIARNKRGEELHGEIFRSRIEALRKIKGDCDERVEIGAPAIDSRCDTMGGLCCTSVPEADPSDPLSVIPTGTGLRLTGDYELNDDGNAEHFVDYYSSAEMGPSVRFAEGRGWLIWHEGENPHWEVDENGDQTMRRMWQKVKQRQLQYVDALEADYQNQVQAWNFNGPMPANVKAAKALWDRWKNFAQLSGNNRNANNAIEAVKSQPGVSIDANKLDSNPFLLGVANGVIELSNENVRLRKPLATDYITLNTGVPHESSSQLAKNEWNKFLDTFLPDTEERRCIQIALGYTLLGGNNERVIICLVGPTSTGKSTMVAALHAALGDYASTVGLGFFQNKNFNEDLASAITRRIVTCTEFEREDKISSSMIKRLTGGTDKVSTPIKFTMKRIEGVLQSVPVLATNNAPQVSGVDKALENRLHVLPFDTVPKRLDKKAAHVIETVCKGVCLEWLIDGYEEYRRIGYLPKTKRMEDKSKEFMSELDVFADFCNEMIVQSSNMNKPNVRWQDSPEWCVLNENLFSTFEIWWNDNKMPIIEKPSRKKFTTRLQSLGYKLEQKRVEGVSRKFWLGIKIAPKSPTVIQGNFGSDFKIRSVSDTSETEA